MQIALVISEFTEKSGDTIKRLQTSCLARLKELGVNEPEIFAVPGAFEIPVAVKQILTLKKFDAVITLGAVVRGETTHYELISENCAQATSRNRENPARLRTIPSCWISSRK